MIPPIPDHLTAPIPQAAMKNFEPFLAPVDEDEEEESSFRVFCTVRLETEFMIFFFSSANQKWELMAYDTSSYFGRLCRWYAHGCFFWVDDSERNAPMVDTREMKFSIIDLAYNDASNDVAIVEAGEGRLGLLTLGDSTIDLYFKTWRNNGVGAEGWQHDKTIPLTKDCDGSNYDWYVMDATGRYLSLLPLRSGHEVPMGSECFVLDLKTMLLERLCVLNDSFGQKHLYASFPPPFAPPNL
ncbi:unnamed protein product [Urochloa humidicola]